MPTRGIRFKVASSALVLTAASAGLAAGSVNGTAAAMSANEGEVRRAASTSSGAPNLVRRREPVTAEETTPSAASSPVWTHLQLRSESRSGATRTTTEDELRGSLDLVSVEAPEQPLEVDPGQVETDDRVSIGIYTVLTDFNESIDATTYVEDLVHRTRRTLSIENSHLTCDLDADGSHLLYIAQEQYSGDQWLRVLDVATGQTTDLLSQPEVPFECGELSGDGGTAVYHLGHRVVVHDVATGEVTYAPRHGRGALISADGRRVAYAVVTEGREHFDEKFKVNYVVWNRVTGAARVVATHYIGPRRSTTMVGFAPSGGFVVVHRSFSERYNLIDNPDPRKYDVLSAINVRTGNVTRLAAGNFRNQWRIADLAAPVSSSSRYVTYMSTRRDLTKGSDRDRYLDVFRYDMSTGRTIRLTNPKNGGAVAWTPISGNGKRLLIESTSRLTDQDHDRHNDLYIWQAPSR